MRRESKKTVGERLAPLDMLMWRCELRLVVVSNGKRVPDAIQRGNVTRKPGLTSRERRERPYQPQRCCPVEPDATRVARPVRGRL